MQKIMLVMRSGWLKGARVGPGATEECDCILLESLQVAGPRVRGKVQHVRNGPLVDHVSTLEICGVAR